MQTSTKIGLGLLAFYVFLLATVVTGWFMNIADLLTQSEPTLVMLVLRVVGIFVAPLGAFLGIFF